MQNLHSQITSESSKHALLTILAFCTCLSAGCGGNGFFPPASEKATDLHYGLAVYFAELDPMMDLSPYPRLVLAQLRQDARKVSIVRVYSEFAAGPKKKRLNGEKLKAKLIGYGARLKNAMSDEEQTRFQSLIPAQLYGVRVEDKDGFGVVHYNAKFLDGKPMTMLEAPFENFKDFVSLEAIDEILGTDEIDVLDPAVRALIERPVEPLHRASVCKALLNLAGNTERDLDRQVNTAFVKWANQDQLDGFETLLLAGKTDDWYKRATMEKFLELDSGRAVEYIKERAPDEQMKLWLDFFKESYPDRCREISLALLKHEDMDFRKKAMSYLGKVGKTSDISAINESAETADQERKQSLQSSAKFAIRDIEVRN